MIILGKNHSTILDQLFQGGVNTNSAENSIVDGLLAYTHEETTLARLIR